MNNHSIGKVAKWAYEREKRTVDWYFSLLLKKTTTTLFCSIFIPKFKYTEFTHLHNSLQFLAETELAVDWRPLLMSPKEEPLLAHAGGRN